VRSQPTPLKGSDPLRGGGATAVVVARGGSLPAGADEAVAEAGGRAIVVGEGARAAAEAMNAVSVSWAETGFRPGALARALAPVLPDVVVLPASPDGRDLAPRLAAELGRPLFAGAIRVEPLELSRLDGRVTGRVDVEGPFVATLLPGVRSVPELARASTVELPLELEDRHDARLLEVLEPRPETIDLAEAPRVLAGGAGIGEAGFPLLVRVAAALGASAGATRVATDAGWIGHERQIGTTGVAISPELYVAFGVSGASQHVGGLGAPRHVVSVNTDPSSPMTAMADLGLVTDARALLEELARRLHA
jgi:electron transfer flavoprotein alpha subunit